MYFHEFCRKSRNYPKNRVQNRNWVWLYRGNHIKEGVASFLSLPLLVFLNTEGCLWNTYKKLHSLWFVEVSNVLVTNILYCKNIYSKVQ
jgi:hypothetical protein